MKDKMKGKIFNAQEVQAMLNGSKVMFREVIKPRQPRENHAAKLRANKTGKLICMEWKDEPELRIKGFGTDICKCPYQVGQEIFCKESFGFEANGYGEFFVYKSDNPAAIYAKTTLSKEVSVKWEPARNMKQEHSRLTLLIKEIRVERLASISCADYFAETGRRPISHMDLDCDTPDPRNDFAAYWNATHKKPEEKFEANPWVWVCTMEVVK